MHAAPPTLGVINTSLEADLIPRQQTHRKTPLNMDGRNPATVAIGVDIPTPLATILTTATSSLAAAATVAATTTASMTFVSSEHNPATPPVPEGECRLLGSFALLVQAALGGLALLVLVFKRYRERPQRPVKIWFFDASKQVFGSVLVHIANVFMSMLTSGRFTIKPPLTVATPALVIRDGFLPNPCSFYLLNLGIDVRRDHTLHTCVR